MAEVRTQRTKRQKQRFDPVLASILGTAAYNNLPTLTQAENVLSGTPADAVASHVLADGSPGVMLSDGSVVPASILSQGLGTIPAAAGVVAGTALTAQGVNDALQGRSGNPLARIQSGISTGGFTELARMGGLGHKSTKDYQNQRTQDLLKMGYTPDQLKLRTGTATTNPGQKANWDTNDMSNPLNLMGSEGMLNYGPDYLNKLSHQDRYMLTKYAIDNNLFHDDKGDKVIRDADMARIRQEQANILKNPDYLAHFNARNETFSPVATTPGKSMATSPLAANPNSNLMAPANPNRGYTAVGPDGVLRNVAPGTQGTSEAAGGDNKLNALKMIQSLMPGQAAPKLNQIPQMEQLQQQSVLQTPQDYNNAFIGLYERNTGNQIFNPLSRRF